MREKWSRSSCEHYAGRPAEICQAGLACLETAGYNHASFGLVAQLVEQRIENPCVGGSIPPRATKEFSSSASSRTPPPGGVFVSGGTLLVSGLFPAMMRVFLHEVPGKLGDSNSEFSLNQHRSPISSSF